MAFYGPPTSYPRIYPHLPVVSTTSEYLSTVWIKRKICKRKKPKYISKHEKVCPFLVGQIIFNKKRPTIRRLVIGEPRLINKTVWSRHRTCWEIPVLNIRKSANNGKKSMLVIELTRIKNFEIFSDSEVASVLECANIE